LKRVLLDVSVPNLRDVGGYSPANGAVVRRGLAYRCSQLNPVNPEDMKKIVELALKKDFDLRTTEEVKACPDELPSGVQWVGLNVLADAKRSAPAELERLMHDPQQANVVLGDGNVEAIFEQAYREFISLPSAKLSYRQDVRFPRQTGSVACPLLLHDRQRSNRMGSRCPANLAWRAYRQSNRRLHGE
jgi:protein-tyrosine phosphatase